MEQELGVKDYHYEHGEPGMCFEVYLPKKADYQPILYAMLASGLKGNAVPKHFRDRSKRTGITNLLRRNTDLVGYSPRWKRYMPVPLAGYSIYEVDGAFKASRLHEERVVVVRLMFLPPLQNIGEGLSAEAKRFLARRFLRFWTHKQEAFLAEHWWLDPHERRFVDDLVHWLRHIGLVVWGYVVYEICEKLLQLKGTKAEKEIWVTSIRGLTVERAVLS